MKSKKEYEKELSVMSGVPCNEEDIKDPQTIMMRLEETKLFKTSNPIFEDGTIKAVVNYLGKDYAVTVRPDGYSIPEAYRVEHMFTQSDIKALNSQGVCLVVEMMFSDDFLNSYHLQIKILHVLMPEMVAVFDESSEKILSGRWVKMAAESEIPPAPSYIYTVQAVIGEEDDARVWLHTHGLNRCGLTELEDMEANKDNYNSHYNVIHTYADRAIEEPEILDEKKPVFLARLSEEVFLVVTRVNWEEVIDNYPDDYLGTGDDRKEGHNKNTSLVYAYANPDDCEKGIYSAISIYDELLEDNPLYMLTNAETRRMSALARERISYFEKAITHEGSTLLAKIALKTDKEFEEYSNFEHIWFEIKNIGNGKLSGVLTQDPYYIKGIEAGYEGEYSYNNVTDWVIFCGEERITPDTAYLIDIMGEE